MSKTTQLKDGEDEMDDMTTSQRPRSHETTADDVWLTQAA